MTPGTKVDLTMLGLATGFLATTCWIARTAWSIVSNPESREWVARGSAPRARVVARY